jgi:flagellar biosynthetic protein FliP
VAVVRYQGRLLLLSYGDGGVHLLKEGPEGEEPEEAVVGTGVGLRSQRREDGGRAAVGEIPGGGLHSFPTVWSRIRKVAGNGGIALLLLGLLGGLSAAEGQVPGAEAIPGATQVSASQGEEGAGQAQAVNPLSPEAAIYGIMRQLPDMNLQIGGDGDEGLKLSGPVGTVLFMGFLTLLPTLLLLMTGFTRILVVLHLLKQAIGTQTAPPTHLLTAMALLLTGFVMAPTLSEVNRTALTPWLDGEMDELEMIRTASVPFRAFMVGSTGEEDLVTFLEMHGTAPPETMEEIPMVVVTSAFVTSELRHAFQMGFALFLPFVVIDIVVASVLMSMGMFMLPPVMVSLPFKLLLFVLVDGWSLILGGLVRSFG